MCVARLTCCEINIWGRSLIVIGVYRPPSAPPLFLEGLYDFVNCYCRHKFVIARDFNLGSIDWTTLQPDRNNLRSSEVLLLDNAFLRFESSSTGTNTNS